MELERLVAVGVCCVTTRGEGDAVSSTEPTSYELVHEAYGAMRCLLLAADVLDITEPAHAEVASAIETDLLETFRRIERFVATHPLSDLDGPASLPGELWSSEAGWPGGPR